MIVKGRGIWPPEGEEDRVVEVEGQRPERPGEDLKSCFDQRQMVVRFLTYQEAVATADILDGCTKLTEIPVKENTM